LSALAGPLCAAPTALERAEAAVRQLEAGDLRGAAVTTRQALDAAPGETLLHNLAAALLMMTGDANGASAAWTNALRDLPDDGLALYGLGLACLARRDYERARTLFQRAANTGERACCLLAERYLESLNGAVGGGTGLTLPDAFSPSALGLSGMAAARTGDYNRALNELTASLTALPGDPTAEPMGPVMTFDAAAPLRFGAGRLPTGNGLIRRNSRERPLSGTVTLAPDHVTEDAGYVVFRIDGSVSSVANTPPFRLVWDTAKVPNGLHRVEIMVYDRQGQEISRAAKELRTANADAPKRRSLHVERTENVRAALWKFLILRPSRRALSYAAAESARAIGNRSAVERYLELTAALDPGYRDTRARLAVLNRGTAETAFWRGAPNDKVIALTFDDGPRPGLTEALLAILMKERVPATFFVVGRSVTAYPELTRKIAQAGMQIENHSYTHRNLTLLPPAAVEREMLRTMVAVRETTGMRMKYYRPPGGNTNGSVSRIAAQWGLTPCMWTVGGEAYENGSPNRLIAHILKRASPGAIILLHNGRRTTNEALPRIIAGLRQRGFRFVTIDQLAQRKAQWAISRRINGAVGQ
jgi:peptidoglycan/xylan/chitin deacetylase (PgdA/CDA1 family)